MRRFLSFVTALVLFAIIIFSSNSYMRDKINAAVNPALWYTIDPNKFSDTELAFNNTGSSQILLLGSSELETTYINTHPMNLFYNNQIDFNMYLVGGGNYQSLWHAVYVGAMDDKIASHKVVLIVSPQWFTSEGTPPEAFQARYSPVLLKEFLDNKNISETLKNKIKNRCAQLDVGEESRIEYFSDQFKHNFELNKLISSLEKKEYVAEKSYRDIDWDALLIQAEKDGAAACHNEFHILDDYYNVYMRGKLDQIKAENANLSFAESKEYDDLELFLEICSELDIRPLIVISPFNGLWYDYLELDRSERELYYSKIRNMCEIWNAEYADFSSMEYEDYFLCDITHFGWKGWLYVNKNICTFYEDQK